MELIFSEKGVPRGRGKIERFFRSVNDLLLQNLPGYCPAGQKEAQATLTLAAFEQTFRTWLLSDYHQRVHSETKCPPAERWQRGGFLPRMPDSLERLDLLLLTVAKTRRVQQDGIRFQGYRYIDPTLAGYVKEEVLIRYDPSDLAEIRVYHQDLFLCRAISPELAGQTVSLKEIEKARSERRKQVRAGLTTRQALVEQFLAVHQEEPASPPPVDREPAASGTRPRLKRYINE
jgi:putative transposase